MNFLNYKFYLFFLLVFILYYLTKKKYRYLVLLISSYLFYGMNDISFIPILLLSTIITYIGGKILEKKSSKKVYLMFLSLNLLILIFYKYTNFFLDSFNDLTNLSLKRINLIIPLGLSFYIFQSSTYLNDIYKKRIGSENNFLKYATFVSFFPTLLSGPIQKSRDFIPILNNPQDFSFENGRKGLILILWGLFQKLVVANNLFLIVDLVFKNYQELSGVYCLIGAMVFSFYIYTDFSSYSDISLGVGKILGFNLKKNFDNPYLATSIGEFWRRWHMSLNNWFVEFIYIPLGGNKKGKLRKYLNILIIFLLSGLWHGASWNFLIWGLLNGIFRILGEILIPIKMKLSKLFKIDLECISIIWLKRIIVFCLITVTWVFFNLELSDAISFLKKLIMLYPSDFFNESILTIGGSYIKTFFITFYLLIFLIIQSLRKDEKKYYCVFKIQPFILQILTLSLLLVIIVFYSINMTSSNTQFIYFDF